MQVIGLPGKVIRSAGFASRLLAASIPGVFAASGRDAVSRWLRVRARQWDPRLVAELRRLRDDNPLWSKRKLGPILRAMGWTVSDSTVGRILAEFPKRGRIAQDPAFTRDRKARRPRRPHAQRLRKALLARAPGDAVQIDSLKVGLGHGRQVRPFTAIDCAGQWRWPATAGPPPRRHGSSASCPPPCRSRLKAIQIDGGSEFMAEFEAACAARRLPLRCCRRNAPR